MDRMPVEAIAERPVVEDHIKRLVGLWNSTVHGSAFIMQREQLSS
jgi:hypothetical protein